ncbi:MAG: RNA polymerase sigma factor [Streptosporangiales bacterium]
MAADDAQAAFAAVFDTYQPAVYGYLLGRLGDREHARDLLQETFLRVWRRLAEVRALPDGRQRAWIFTVAKNLTTDSYRATGTRQATQQALERDAPTAAPGYEQPEARAETGERVDEVTAAIRTLPEDLRVVLTMHAVGELTSAQIGAALDQPAGTVRYKLAQARKQLATILEA